MSQRKLRITGYYGHKTDTPFNFIPNGIHLSLLLHRVDGFKIEHDIDVDDEMILQFIDYNKAGCGCGSMAGMRELI